MSDVAGIPLHGPNEPPGPEGVRGVGELTPDDGPTYHQARVSAAAGLKDLEADYAFFNHGLLFTHGDWDVDPVADYVRRVDAKCCPFAIRLPRPVFRGMDRGRNREWNSTLMAVHRSQWDGLLSFMAGLSAINRRRRRYHRLAVQQLPLIDILAFEKSVTLPDPIPMTTVALFALEGDWSTVGFAPAATPPLGLIRVIQLPAEEEVIKLSWSLFAEQDRPFEAVESSTELAKERLYRDRRLPDVPPDSPGETSG